MSFEDVQKGLFTFYLEQTPLLSPTNNQVPRSQPKYCRYKPKSEANQCPKMPYMPYQPFVTFTARHKSEEFSENAAKCEENRVWGTKQPKQKNKHKELVYTEILGQNIRNQQQYNKISEQYSNVFSLKARLEDLKTHKIIASHQNIAFNPMQSLTMRKNQSQQQKIKSDYNFTGLRFQTMRNCIQKSEESQPQGGYNQKLKKKALALSKPKKVLKSKIKEVKPFSEVVPLVEQKQNEKAKVSHIHERGERGEKRSYKRYKRVNNPIKHVNQPYLEPISSHRIRPFRQYLVSIEQFCKLDEISRGSHCLKFSENFPSFAPEKEADCLRLMSELRRVGHS